MAATHEIAPDALPYFDQGYDDQGVREMVRLKTTPKVKRVRDYFTVLHNNPKLEMCI